MELLTELFSAEHMEMQRKAIHASFEEQHKKQGENHLVYLATLYTRAKQFPSPLMPSHIFSDWEELRKSEHPSCRIILWLEDELKYWLGQTDRFRKSIDVWTHIPRDGHESMLRVALIAENKRLKEWRVQS